MRIRVERLRVWLLGSAIFLILVISAFIVTAHYLRRHLLAKLPARLGLDIESGALDYTSSHANGSTTTYSIHAARWEKHKDGKITLHDVSVMLYGAKGDRRDRIYGDEFEYDQSAGVVRATGVVHMDLEAATAAAGAAGGKGGAGATTGGAANARVLHVTTSGLVYLEKLGVAATSDYIEFETGGLKGHATGADYASDSGMLMLHSAVSMSGVAGGRPVQLDAARAELDDRDHEVFLTRAKYSSPGRTAEAEQATLYLQPDGTLERVEAQGNVTMAANGGTAVSQRADVGLTADGQLRTAVLTKGVTYALDGPLRQVSGQADAATIDFDGQTKPQPKHAVFTGAVHMTERTRAATSAREPWSTRELTAEKVEAELAPAGPGRSELRDVEAAGSPHLTYVNSGSLASTKGAGTTELAADDLKAHLSAATDPKAPPHVETIAARGHTMVHQSKNGVDETSTGDTLNAKFRPAAAGRGPGVGAANGADALESAVQQGHVAMVRRAPKRAGAQAGSGAAVGGKAQTSVEHASGARAVYDGNLDRLTLTGSVAVKDEGSELWANQVAFDRATGDAHATGAVKVNYVQERAPGGAARTATEPAHVLADRAELDHATDVATFYGKPVRVWQEGSQVQAPVVELARAQQRLIAHGEASTGWSAATGKPQVWTVLTRSGGPSGSAGGSATKAASGGAACANPASQKAGASPAAAKSQAADVVTIASGGLIYSGILRQAEFTGGVRANTVDGTIRSNQATVYLVAKEQLGAGSASEAAEPSLAGDLDRVVATGQVKFDQPALDAKGERLVYTASDRVILLTGDGHTLPTAVNPQGTTTGAALRMQRLCDGSGDTVEVLGTVPGEPAQRVRTDARVPNEEKKDKGRQ